MSGSIKLLQLGLNKSSSNILQHDQLDVQQGGTRTSRILKEMRNKNPSRARMRSRSRRRRRRRRRRQRDSGGPCTLRVARSQTVNGTCSRLGTCRHGDKEEFTLVRQLQLNLIKNNENFFQDCHSPTQSNAWIQIGFLIIEPSIFNDGLIFYIIVIG